jgi:acetyl esterase
MWRAARCAERHRQQGFRSFEQIGLEATRGAIASFTALQHPPRQVAGVADTTYGPDPAQRARVYIPPGNGPFPVILLVHGGGFVGGGLDVVDERARALALDVSAVVVAATYRLAPEARFPSAHDDVLAALQWTARGISAHRGDPQRVALLGDSAGANLAASAAIRARDAGEPAIRSLVLFCPLVNPVADPRLALDRNPLAGLPPTLVVTVEYDPLRDEGEQFAAALRASGVDVTSTRIDGLVHTTYSASAAVPRSAEIHNAAVRHLRTSLAA